MLFSPQLLPEKTPATTLKIGNGAAWVSADYPGNFVFLTGFLLFCFCESFLFKCFPSHSNSLTLDFSFDRSDELPLDLYEDIFANFENRK